MIVSITLGGKFGILVYKVDYAKFDKLIRFMDRHGQVIGQELDEILKKENKKSSDGNARTLVDMKDTNQHKCQTITYLEGALSGRKTEYYKNANYCKLCNFTFSPDIKVCTCCGGDLEQ